MPRMTEKKSGAMFALIYLIAFALFNLIVFFAFTQRGNVFWLSYAFMAIAFVVQMCSTFFAFQKLDVESAFFGIPLVSLSLYYFFAAIFVGGVFMFFQFAPIQLALVLQALILGVYAIVAILSLMGRDVVQDTNDHIRQSVSAVSTMNAEVSVLLAQAADPALKTALKKLGDTIRYSDPMSTPAVANVEGEIGQSLTELRVLCENGRSAEAAECCRRLEMLFLRRNQLLKASK